MLQFAGDLADRQAAAMAVRAIGWKRQIPALAKAFGTQQLLYASDYCWTPPAAALAHASSLDAAPQSAPDTWRTLTSRNGLPDSARP
ncbi:hypothetical protein OHB25_05545 [Streptomyces mirabilis]|uniref:hypothetical protein n=1 Tax=Streptomyces mirabilis TaxID=68239 RepID=UPI002E1AA0B4